MCLREVWEKDSGLSHLCHLGFLSVKSPLRAQVSTGSCRCIIFNTNWFPLPCRTLLLSAAGGQSRLTRQRLRQLAFISRYLKDDMTRSVLINWSGHQTKHTQKAEPGDVIDEQIYYIWLQRGRRSKRGTWYDEPNERYMICLQCATQTLITPPPTLI